MVALPEELEINAWAGALGTRSAVANDAAKFAKRRGTASGFFMPAAEAAPTDWRHPDIGWGIVLPENDTIPPKERARADDAEKPIRDLLASRPGSPVFRFDATWDKRLTHLRRYFPDGSKQEPLIVGGKLGIAPNCVPLYLLIAAGPAAIPWELQFVMNGPRYVGRLDLSGAALERYVRALISDFADATADKTGAIVWGVDHGTGDITTLMRGAIADPLAARIEADATLRVASTKPEDATHAELTSRLADRKPGLVVTTSHGATSPLDDANALREQLGLLVDLDQALLDPTELLGSWQPDGAIWYAHACCSAGASAETGFDGLVTKGGAVHKTLLGVCTAGECVAPLPRALLGAEKPLRAFIGHVEPTFDWTLREPSTKELLVDSLLTGLYQRMFTRAPVAHALEVTYRQGTALLRLHDAAMKSFNEGGDTLGTALACKLMSRDRERIVILGDPTVALA